MKRRFLLFLRDWYWAQSEEHMRLAVRYGKKRMAVLDKLAKYDEVMPDLYETETGAFERRMRDWVKR